MPTTGTDRQTFRLDADTWNEYNEACKAKGTDRSSDLRAYIQREIRRWKRTTAQQQKPGEAEN